MTFPPDDEYGELLRRALRAEADSVVPSPDGLEIIRGRIDQRGLRGLRHMLWWRVGAAAAGAVLVAQRSRPGRLLTRVLALSAAALALQAAVDRLER